MGLRTCKWHKCGASFAPQHGSQEYCSKAHRVKMLEWKKARGARLVTMLLETPLGKLDATMRAERRKLMEEINDHAER